MNLNYSAHDFRNDSAHYRACSFCIVKPGAKVITIEPSEDASSMEEVVKLFSGAFEQTCALKVIDGFAVNCLTRELTAAEVTAVLEKLKRLPSAVLSDHGCQFKEQWKEWRCERRVEVVFARPSYPQDKGEVERRVQYLNWEFVNHLGKFPEWLKVKLGEYKEWFNHSRFHRGIKAHPADLYKCNVRNLT